MMPGKRFFCGVTVLWPTSLSGFHAAWGFVNTMQQLQAEVK
jgi:hypothetical protein